MLNGHFFSHYQKGDKDMLLYSCHLSSSLNSICMFHIYVKPLPEVHIATITTPYSTVPWAVTIINIIQKHICPFVSKREGEDDEKLRSSSTCTEPPWCNTGCKAPHAQGLQLTSAFRSVCPSGLGERKQICTSLLIEVFSSCDYVFHWTSNL